MNKPDGAGGVSVQDAPITHKYHRINAETCSVEVSGKVIGYVSRRQSTEWGGSHWAIRFDMDGEWMGRYETRREAREALMRAVDMPALRSE